MTRRYELTGKRFNKLVVLGVSHSRKVKSGTRKYWLCRCDCGNETKVISSSLASGKTKSCGCYRREEAKKRVGKKHHNWKGGWHKTQEGYVKVMCKGHPNSRSNGYILEHVLVMTENLGRPLFEGEQVHHINGIKNDNRIENLELWNKSQPNGTRLKDKISWCKEFLRIYEPDALR